MRVLIVCLLLLCRQAAAFTLLREPSGVPISWNSTLAANGSVTWRIASVNAPPGFADAAQDAADRWSAATAGFLSFRRTEGDAADIAIYWDHNFVQKTKFPNAVAYAVWASDGNGNAKIASISFDAERKWEDREIAAAMVHEFGHAIGLGHSDDPENIVGTEIPVMAAMLMLGGEVLRPDDIAGAMTIYCSPASEPLISLTPKPRGANARVRRTIRVSVKTGVGTWAFWDFGDGTRTVVYVGEKVRHRYTKAGIYGVVLIAGGQRETRTITTK